MNPTLSAVIDHLEVARQAAETARAVDGDAVATSKALEVITESITDAVGLLMEIAEQSAA